MTNTIIEFTLTFNFKNKLSRQQQRLPKGAEILKNNSDPDPLKIFALYQGVPNGHQEDVTFLLIKQEKNLTEVKDIKLDSASHLRTFTNQHGTWHLFKLPYE